MAQAYCTNCGHQIELGDRFCRGCGAAHSTPSSLPRSMVVVEHGINWKRWLLIAAGTFVGIIVVLVVIGFVLGSVSDENPITKVSAIPRPNTLFPTPTPFPTLTFPQAKLGAETISYDDLFRNNEQHVGTSVYFRAKVIQVINAGTDTYQLRANVTERTFGWDDTVFLRYKGPRLLEDDVIEFVGSVFGLVTYESVLGGEITIPDIVVGQTRRITN